MPVDDVDELFEMEPDEFVRARDELAKRLRDEGRRDEANEVRRMRRPNVVVWALNQVARRHPDGVEELLAAGEAVRTAQHQRAGAQLRAAGDALQKQVARVAASAAALLVQTGVASSDRRDELEAALRAGALGGDGEELRAGRLERLPAAPLGESMWTAGAEPAGNDIGGADVTDSELVEARERYRRAESEVEQARAHVVRSEEQLTDLIARLDRERTVLDEARRRLEVAERRAHEARRQIERLEPGAAPPK